MLETILWRRLDVPGHDACRLMQNSTGPLLEGTAVFSESGRVATLNYAVQCDHAWRALNAEVHGWFADVSVEARIARDGGGEWMLNGVAIRGLRDCLDLDLGFTPATNLLALHRINLSEGEAAETPAAWFDPAQATLLRLPQRYERRSRTSYWYESPPTGYAAVLQVTDVGFVRSYPGLWEAEP